MIAVGKSILLERVFNDDALEMHESGLILAGKTQEQKKDRRRRVFKITGIGGEVVATFEKLRKDYSVEPDFKRGDIVLTTSIPTKLDLAKREVYITHRDGILAVLTMEEATEFVNTISE